MIRHIAVFTKFRRRSSKVSCYIGDRFHCGDSIDSQWITIMYWCISRQSLNIGWLVSTLLGGMGWRVWMVNAFLLCVVDMGWEFLLCSGLSHGLKTMLAAFGCCMWRGIRMKFAVGLCISILTLNDYALGPCGFLNCKLNFFHDFTCFVIYVNEQSDRSSFQSFFQSVEMYSFNEEFD